MKFKIITILIVFLVSANGIFGQQVKDINQLNDTELAGFLKKAQESGMSEAEITTAAAARGYTTMDIQRFKDRISTLKLTKDPLKSKVKTKLRTSDSTEIVKNGDREIEETLEQRNKRLEDEKIRSGIFGLNIFNNKEINFEPNLQIATPKNYILGTGDELDIDITGYAFAHYNAKVSTEGTIKIENLSPIYLNGQTIEQAREKIIQKLKSIFGGLGKGGLSADVTLSKIRSIKVNVIGAAVYPGTYTVSSLATVFNLLYSAGGPTEIGSLRNIEVFRNGHSIKKLDLYDFLLHGDLKDNITLHDQDVVMIPYVDLRASITGNVRNPKIYELKKNENFKTLLEYAGGFSDYAYQKSIKLFRNTDTEKKIIVLDKVNFNTFYPVKGDEFYVDSVSNVVENAVFIVGSVKRQGWYELESAPTLKKLIAKAEGLKQDAFTNRILIKRNLDNFEPEFLQIDFAKILEGSAPDIVLHKLDSVLVKSYTELKGLETIIINGEVNQPKTLPFVTNMTLGDAVMLAGGFTDGASLARIEIARRVYSDNIDSANEKTIDIINIKLNSSLHLENDVKDMVLRPFDKIFVRKLARYEDQKVVTISGEVNYPGPYSMLDKTEKISDLIKKSGGLRKDADLKSAKFIRNGNAVGVDLEKILDNPNDFNNLMLTDGDGLTIPRKQETVVVNGSVFNPTIVPYQKDLKFKDYISLAGGFNDSAFVSKTYVRYGNNKMQRTQNYLGFKIYPKVHPGTEIIVPVKKTVRWTAAERIAVSSAVISIATVMISIILRVIPNN